MEITNVMHDFYFTIEFPIFSLTKQLKTFMISLMFETILLVLTSLLTALLAGVFFGYAVSVNGGLARLKDKEYIAAMQSINVVILNPLFMATFMGPVILLPVITFLLWNTPDAFLLLAASIIYLVGVFGSTAGGNVPLNEKLAKCDLKNVSEKEIADARKLFEKAWNRLHIIRTLAAIAATTFLLIACVN
jgi:uncharacterized membrane protein